MSYKGQTFFLDMTALNRALFATFVEIEKLYHERLAKFHQIADYFIDSKSESHLKRGIRYLRGR